MPKRHAAHTAARRVALISMMSGRQAARFASIGRALDQDRETLRFYDAHGFTTVRMCVPGPWCRIAMSSIMRWHNDGRVGHGMVLSQSIELIGGEGRG